MAGVPGLVSVQYPLMVMLTASSRLTVLTMKLWGIRLNSIRLGLVIWGMIVHPGRPTRNRSKKHGLLNPRALLAIELFIMTFGWQTAVGSLLVTVPCISRLVLNPARLQRPRNARLALSRLLRNRLRRSLSMQYASMHRRCPRLGSD